MAEEGTEAKEEEGRLFLHLYLYKLLSTDPTVSTGNG